jgi:hypothetical protein
MPEGLSPRHAPLAANAAFTWCQFILDTLVKVRHSGISHRGRLG